MRRRWVALTLVGVGVLIASQNPAGARADTIAGKSVTEECGTRPHELVTVTIDGAHSFGIDLHVTAKTGADGRGAVVVGQWQMTGAAGQMAAWRGPGSFWSKYNDLFNGDEVPLYVKIAPGATGTATFRVWKTGSYGGCYSIDHVVVHRWMRNTAPPEGGWDGGPIVTPTPRPPTATPTPTPPAPSGSPDASAPPSGEPGDGWCWAETPEYPYWQAIPCKTPTPSPTPSPSPSPSPGPLAACLDDDVWHALPAGSAQCLAYADLGGTPQHEMIWLVAYGYMSAQAPGYYKQFDVWLFGADTQGALAALVAGATAGNASGALAWSVKDMSGDSTTGTEAWGTGTNPGMEVRPPRRFYALVAKPRFAHVGWYTNGASYIMWNKPAGCPGLTPCVEPTPEPSPSPSPSPSSSTDPNASETPPPGWPSQPPPQDTDGDGQYDPCAPGTIASERALCDEVPEWSFAPGAPAPDGMARLLDKLEGKAPFGYVAQAVGAVQEGIASAPGAAAPACVTIPVWMGAGQTQDAELCIPWDLVAQWGGVVRTVLLALLLLGVAVSLLMMANGAAKGA